ncbi:MFS transporter [Desulfatirhabdium butyrativorans]|uniref:MFS transporter n=1 Tax=Desulfatirhabdium butyrativorans TaxID=340467 RepID=UPI00041C1F9A|nr:MFS transporter [Desulfatirhabdium butyrativorans]
MKSRKRKTLACSTSLIIATVLLFLWITNKGQPADMQGVLDNTLLILSAFAVIVLMFFIFFGDFFHDDGTMQKNQIILILTTVICIIQATLAFAVYSMKQLEFENESLNKAKAIFATIKQDLSKPDFRLATIQKTDEISSIYITDDQKRVIMAQNASLIGRVVEVDPLRSYRFPLGNRVVVMDISAEYQRKMVTNILLDLLTVLVASIILTVELILFMIRSVEDRFDSTTRNADQKAAMMTGYVRHIAFFFFFVSRMASTFIALIAKNLGGSFWGIKDNVLAGVPQSAEFLLTCVAIFATSTIIERKGWKTSFTGGLLIVAGGTLLSAFSAHILMFIVSRAVVGLGYGFCWMTLRNFALFTNSDMEKINCFSMLNAGIYAGIICGAVTGAVLADILGYRLVLVVSAVLTASCVLSIKRFQNLSYSQSSVDGTTSTTGQGDMGGRCNQFRKAGFLHVLVFTILMIVPSCIMGSYLSYYIPIFFNGLGKLTSDIGRTQLVYGLVIVYIGPHLIRLIHRHPNLFNWNIGYNILFSLALTGFGLWGGFIQAMLVVFLLGIADSFGFAVQNNYFLNFEYARLTGESHALSLISLIKKLAEMLGPIAFGLTFLSSGFNGITVMGFVFLGATILYVFISKGWRNHSQLA